MTSNPTEAPAWWGERPSGPCGRPTKAGTLCPQGRVAASVYDGFRVVWESPACKTHLTAEEREAQQAVEAQMSAAHVKLEPACWSWALPTPEDLSALFGDVQPDVLRRLRLDPDAAAFVVFHDGRCAVCGRRTSTVQDHDHSTGMRRGDLCRNCNTSEGVSGHPLFQKYRARNPASILGVQLPYTGIGWDDGVPLGGWASPTHRHGPRDVRPESAWIDNAATNLGF